MTTHSKVSVFKPKIFLSVVSVPSILLEPKNHKNAKGIVEWEKGKKLEYKALLKSDTWKLLEFPKDSSPIWHKWIYIIKVRSEGKLDKFMTSLVTKCYFQQEAIDFFEPFSPNG